MANSSDKSVTSNRSANNNEYTAEEIERMKKINDCVEKGSLMVGAGIAVGCAVSVITINPGPVYLGFLISSVISAVNCYTNFDENWRLLIPSPCGLVGAGDSLTPPVDSQPDDNNEEEILKCKEKGILWLKCDLPCVTDKNREFIKTKQKERFSQEHERSDSVVCAGSILDDQRFKLPSCMDRPCLSHDNTDIVDVSTPTIPLKRFQSPLRPDDVTTMEEAIKATFETFPLKRFKRPKVVIDRPNCTNS